MYAAAASLSGAADMAELNENMDDYELANLKREFENIFGDLAKLRGSEHDLFHLADNVSRRKKNVPLLYQCCGTEDFLYKANVKFRDHCAEISLPVCYEEAPGDHNWAFWDEYIQKVLAWLPIPPLNTESTNE